MPLTLPNHREFWNPDRLRPRTYCGVLLRVVPGDTGQLVEWSRAPDSSGSPGTWQTLDRTGPYPRSGGVYFDPLPLDAAYWWYRCRHIAEGGATGNYLQIVQRIQARQIDDLAFAAAMTATNVWATSPDELELGAAVRGAADVVFGESVKYPPTRHNEQLTGVDTSAVTFGSSYDQIPEVRVLPQIWELPGTSSTVARKMEFRATDITVAGCTVRAVMSTGASAAAQTNDFAATLNGTPVGAGISIGAPSSVAYCNLASANGVSTTYKVFFDINTTSKAGGGLTRIKVYKNDGTASTSWTQVGQASYDDGLNLTGEVIQFTATLSANFDVRLEVTYSAGTPTTNATVVADRVDYDAITTGTEASLTAAADSALLVQAQERSG